MQPLAETDAARVFCADWRALLEVVPACDALVTDCPYSAKTHAGHDATQGLKGHRGINYAAWTEEDVREFVSAWSPRTQGWFCTVTDHVLAPIWAAALEAQGRYVFAPLPFVHLGRGVRLSGDGPSSWTCWIVVARPCIDNYATWGTLPGAYVQPSRKRAGSGYRSPVVGGKTTWLGRRLAEDYSRPGDLVVDPCCGAGALPVGALCAGRRVLCGDVDAEHAQLAAEWCRRPHGPPPGGDPDEAPAEQGRLAL